MDSEHTPNLTKFCGIPLPDSLPVMVLSDCYLFPGCILPLFIFEERYRLMLEQALSTSRMFCIGFRERGGGEDDIGEVSTAGLIRASVKNADGTSHLVLCGLQRIRLTGWVQEKPYRIATVEPIQSCCCCQKTLEGLRDEALRLLAGSHEAGCEDMDTMLEKLRSISEPEFICDLLSYHFIHRAPLLQSLLGEPSVERRFGLVISELEKSARGSQ